MFLYLYSFHLVVVLFCSLFWNYLLIIALDFLKLFVVYVFCGLDFSIIDQGIKGFVRPDSMLYSSQGQAQKFVLVFLFVIIGIWFTSVKNMWCPAIKAHHSDRCPRHSHNSVFVFVYLQAFCTGGVQPIGLTTGVPGILKSGCFSLNSCGRSTLPKLNSIWKTALLVFDGFPKTQTQTNQILFSKNPSR